MTHKRSQRLKQHVRRETFVTVRSEPITYPVLTGEGLLGSWGPWWRDADLLDLIPVIVTDRIVRRLHGASLEKALRSMGLSPVWAVIPIGETSKSWRQAERIMSVMTRHQPGRRLCVVAFGGGVVGDLAGFVASVYRRGVPLVHIPTTLLAQVDSAVGGKTGVDLPAGKNLAGTFYHPRVVFCDTMFLNSLSRRQLRNGLAEVVKYGAIADAGLIRLLEQDPARWIDPGRAADLSEIVHRCAAIKAAVVSRDERERKGRRTRLNFGHTFAHAIEAADGFERYQHGEAVGLGMRAAVWLSVRHAGLSAAAAGRLHRLLDALGFDRRVEGLTAARIMKPMGQDKKFKGPVKRFVLLKRLGRAYVDDSVPAALVEEAVRRLIQGYW